MGSNETTGFIATILHKNQCKKIVEKTVGGGGECGVKGVIDAYVQYKP